jgi:hypothetical protein
MKIETIVKKRANQGVCYSDGIVVKYDNLCIAEVSDAVGEMLIEKYKGLIFPAGQIPKPAMVRSTPATDKKTSSEAAELKESLQKANSLVASYKSQVVAAQAGENVWRAKCTELMKEIEALRAGNVANTAKVEDSPTATEKEPTADSDAKMLRTKLEDKTVKELKTYAEELGLPVEEYKGMSKANLVNYLIAKTTNV